MANSEDPDQTAPKGANPKHASRNNSRLLFSSVEMFKKPLWQTVWTQIRLLLKELTLNTPVTSIII